jgi:hypothetical protein
MSRIIGLIGAAGSGKSTVANHLEKKYGAISRALADPLKEIVGKAFSLTGEQLYGTQEQKETVDPRYNVSPRWLFQRIGTEGIRYAFGEDVWVETLLKRARYDRLTVVSDVRFVNEAALLHEQEAILIRLNNTNRISKADPKHASEAEWTLCAYDYEITHDGKTLDDLLTPVDRICYREGVTAITLLGGNA